MDLLLRILKFLAANSFVQIQLSPFFNIDLHFIFTFYIMYFDGQIT